MRSRKPVAPEPSPKRAALYVRVSTEEQATEGVSLDAQERQGQAYAIAAGLELVKIFRDEGVSAGKRLRDRPQGLALLDALDAGDVSHVVALKLDRLFRDAVDCLSTVQAWDHAGTALHLIDLGGQSVNTASAMGRFMLTVVAGAAEMERNLIRERTRAALHHKRLRGDRLGTTPLGFITPEPGAAMQPVDVELAAVRLILKRRRRGETFRAIARKLVEDGHATKRGGTWAPETVRRVWERRDAYRGLV